MDTQKIDHGAVCMIAHRGLSGLERENTNAAFVAAGNRSYYGIETDVHKTADGQFVIIHDESTQRVTDGKTDMNVERSTIGEIRDLVLPDRDGRLREDLRIPTLVEYARICKKYKKISVLELKNEFEEDDIQKKSSKSCRRRNSWSTRFLFPLCWKTVSACVNSCRNSRYSGCCLRLLMM